MKVEGTFVVESFKSATNRGKNAVRLGGYIEGVDPQLENDHIEGDVKIIVHPNDDRLPVKLGSKLKIIVTDEGGR